MSGFSSPCSQAISRAVARGERRALSVAGSTSASSRHELGLDATRPNTSAWFRGGARPAIASLWSVGISARSTAVRARS